MEVNMPLLIVMLLDWNPTGPGKGDVGKVSALQYSPAWKLADSREQQVTGETWAPLVALVYHIIVYLGFVHTKLALAFISEGFILVSH